MSKRKRSTPKAGDADAGSETSEGEPSVHVSADVLAGSPDVFAPSKDKPAEGDEPAAMTGGTAEAEAPEAGEDVATAAPAEPVEAVTVSPPPPPTVQPRPPAYVPPAQPQRQLGSTVALGIVLVVLGAFALITQFTGFDASSAWPLFVVIPGLTLLFVGFAGLGTGALIPGAILSVIGLILAYMNASQDWTAWAFVWPLVAPGGVGIGIFLQGLRNRDAQLLRQGRTLMFVALIIFMIGFVIFGTIFKIGGTDYGWFGKAALPGLLIVVGIVLLGRSIQRSRSS